jgi:hypothetical protein
MARSRNAYFIAFLPLATLAGCSSDETGSTAPSSGGSGPGSGGTTTTASAQGGGGSGGQFTASGGTGGVPTGTGGTTSSTNGGGGAGAGSTGTGGTATASSSSGTGGDASLLDQDGDGWTPADGDCCDVDGADCSLPELVNPGAFESLGNLVDDDCDPNTPDGVATPDCGGNPLNTPTSSQELVQAMDLCQTTMEDPPTLKDKKWGVISSALLLADGSANSPKDLQVGVLGDFGTNVSPKKGATMAALSSGTARAEGDSDYVHPQNGPSAGQTGNYNAQTQVNGPADYLAAHGGKFPSPPNCPACSGASCYTAYDSVDLKVRIRVPTNAKSFSYNLKFYSAEFPEFLCKAYNDFFITLLASNAPGLPADHNIAFDANSNPVSVNNGFFEVCFPPPNSPAGTCPAGTLELVGNGMGGWNGALNDGGGTQWLTNDSPIVPGETIEIEFIIWDAGDVLPHNVDSLVLLDKFRWNVTPAAVGTHK